LLKTEGLIRVMADIDKSGFGCEAIGIPEALVKYNIEATANSEKGTNLDSSLPQYDSTTNLYQLAR
jgi:hypothetical protein